MRWDFAGCLRPVDENQLLPRGMPEGQLGGQLKNSWIGLRIREGRRVYRDLHLDRPARLPAHGPSPATNRRCSTSMQRSITTLMPAPLDGAAVPLDGDVVREVQSETGSDPGRLCCKERLEHPALELRWDPGAGVANLNDGMGILNRGLEPNLALAVHGIDGVVDDIGPDLIQLTGVGFDFGKVSRVFTFDPDTAFDLVRQDHQGILQALTQVDVLDRSLVQIGIVLDRSHDRRYAFQAHAGIPHQPVDVRSDGEPTDDDWELGGLETPGEALQLGQFPAAGE